MYPRYLFAPLAALLLLAAPRLAHAQTGGVGIGTTAPDASAALDIVSSAKGVLLPRLSTAQRDGIASPAAGLTIYNTTTNKLNTWNGTSWDASLSATEQPFQGGTVSFGYTGAAQTYTVPTGVFSLQVDATGASGGSDYTQGANVGGAGARVQATLTVTPGQVLTLYVGGAGGFTGSGFIAGGYNGGGSARYGGAGGGATDVRGGGGQLTDRLLVAGGGGGGGYNGYGSQGGAGGNPNGGNGGSANGSSGTSSLSSSGGTQAGGGNVGGSLGTGGSIGGSTGGGGGGGGGYYGGGSGFYNGGGGGGSSWVTPTGSSALAMTAGFQAGNGTLTLTPGPQYVAPVLNGANFVNVPGTWTVSGADVVRPTGAVGIGTTAPDASAALDIMSTSKGLLPPRLSQTQRDAIASPATGLTVYTTTTGKLSTWNGTSWEEPLSATQQPVQGASSTFGYTGAAQTYTVPAGVFSLQVDATGAGGGTNTRAVGTNVGGAGARVQATLTVTPGQVLTLYVGGAGGFSTSGGIGGGYNGGGSVRNGGAGGGATDVRGSGGQLTDRLLVAGGGGGGGYYNTSQGGAGGNPDGGNGTSPRGGGAGATQTTGASDGTGGSGNNDLGGGGGGGGYYGAGGGTYGGGGGGSSWVTPTGSSALAMTAGFQAGNGTLTLTPGPQYVAPALNGANFVNVPGDNLGNHTATQNLNLAAYKLVGNGGSTGLSISSGGSVGIGTTTPGQTLDVAGSANVSGSSTVGGLLTAGSATLGSGTGAVTLPGLSTAGFVTNSASGQLGTTSAASLGANFILNQSTQQTGGTFNVSGAGTVGGTLTAGAASITNNATVGGSLGVGVSGPAGQLANTNGNVIATDGNGISTQGLGWVNTTAVGYAGVFYNANNTASGPGLAVKVASPSAVALDVSQGTAAGTAGTSLLRVSGSGSVGIGTSSPAAGLHIDRPESGSSTALGVLLSGGTTGNPSIELRGSGKSPYLDFVENTGLDYSTRLISQAGTLNLQYGGTATKPTYLLNVQGGILCTAFSNTSDQRLKQDIRPLTGALAAVLALRGVRYEWNPLGVQRGGTAGAGQVGVLAQEVEKVFPELVSTGLDGYKAVNYAQLTPVLIEALKEQQQQIEALKARAATAETQAAKATATLETFEARLRRLEAGSAQAQR